MVTRFDPFEALLQVQRDLEKSRNSDWFGRSTTSRGTFPPVNIFQQEHDLVLIAELAGVRKEDLGISIQSNQLRLSGNKSVEYGEQASMHRRERSSGGFDRTFNLPIEVNPEGAKAEYRDGILAIFLPQAEKDRPKTIAIA